jgi:ribosomal protein S13
MKTFKEFTEAPRIPRKKGQPAGSKKHSDLYTDENPKGTIHGLGFKDVKTAEASVKKIEGSGKSHAHKIQAAIAMEQRARVMGKTAEAAVYRRYIEKMKKITKKKNEETESNRQRLTNTKI